MNAKDPFVAVTAGTVVFREGDAGADMYIIESGSIEIVHPEREHEPVALLEAGDFFGEMAVLEDQPRYASAVAKSDSRLLRIDRSAFADMLRQNVEIAIRIMRKLGVRLRRSEKRAQDARHALDEFKRKLLNRDPSAKVEAPAPAAAPAAPAASAAKGPPAPAPAAAAAAPPASAAAPAPEAAAEPAAPQGLQLRHASGHVFALRDKMEFLVGRPDPVTGINPEINLGAFDIARSLSRRHAKIVLQDGHWVVREDVGTTNGTFVNGERLNTGEAVALGVGDKLKFGSVEVEVAAA